MHTKISGGATVNLKVYQIAKEKSERKKKNRENNENEKQRPKKKINEFL